MDIVVEATSLEEAEVELRARTPAGEFILSRVIERNGRGAFVQAGAPSVEEAFTIAAAKVPAGAQETRREVIAEPREQPMSIATDDEAQARSRAVASVVDGKTVSEVSLETPAKQGFLGIGRKPATWKYTVRHPAQVKVHYRDTARIVARTGARPESWADLMSAMQTIKTSEDAAPLRAAWPHQANFLLVTGVGDDPGGLDGLPLQPVSAAVVERAREYVNRRTLPGMLGMLGGLDPNRYQMVGGSIGRMTDPTVDVAIVSVASCLPRQTFSTGDVEGPGRAAFNAIKHYADIPAVRFLFCLPYTGASERTHTIDVQRAQIDVYKGTEALMLEIYDELGDGDVITDDKVRRKALTLLD